MIILKKLLIAVLIVFIIFIIYLSNVDKEIYYVNISNDDKYTDNIINYLKENDIYQYFYNYTNDKLRIVDIYNGIKSNDEIDDITLKQALIKADLTTIYLGQNDIYNILLLDNYSKREKYKYIDDYMYQLDNMLEIIRKYCKEDIYFIENINIHKDMDIDLYVNYLNDESRKLADKYNIYFIKLDDIYNFIDNDINDDGYNYISNQIITRIKEDILDK